MLLVRVPLNFGGDRNQLHETNLGAPCGHRGHTLDVKTDTNTDKFLLVVSLSFSLHAPPIVRVTIYFFNQRLPLPFGT
jgi:hypothetical protein